MIQEKMDGNHKKIAHTTAASMTKITGIDGRSIFYLPTHLLYLKAEDAVNYSHVREDATDYKNGLHEEIITLMKRCSRELLARHPSLELVDLGPGDYPDKTEELITQAAQAGMELTYIPVDVSDYYLGLVGKAVALLYPLARIHPIQSMFEWMDREILLKAGVTHPLIHLGPTYMNFAPEVATAFLAKMLPLEGQAIVSTELITSSNTPEAICNRYKTPEGTRFVFGSLRNLGCPRENFAAAVNYNPKERRVEFVFECLKETPLACEDAPCFAEEKERIFRPGDRILTAISHRPTYEQFVEDIDRRFGQRSIFLSQSCSTAVAVCGLT